MAPTRPYELVGEGGEASGSRAVPERPMLVWLYPNTRVQAEACGPGGVAAEAVLDAARQLLSADSIDYYAVHRYEVDYSALHRSGDDSQAVDRTVDSSVDRSGDDTAADRPGDDPAVDRNGDDYPTVQIPGDADWRDVSRRFKAFLRAHNAAGRDLYRYRGVHQLIHGESTGCVETADSYAPVGAGAEHTDATAFRAGVVAWSPVCSDEGLTRNAAIQEAVHCFLHSETYSRNLTGDGHDEHTLGRVVDGEATPMLTYHWDDDLDHAGGACPSTDERATGHTQALTACTKEAVAQTAAEKADGRF